MNPDLLTDIACCRVSDLVDHMSYLSSIRDYEGAKFLAKEVALMTRALDNNDTFLVICDPDSLSV